MPAEVLFCPVPRTGIFGAERTANQLKLMRNKMMPTRRSILKGAAALPLLTGGFGLPARAQTAQAASAGPEIPPILFVHGNGDHAALWITTLWRMESNGVGRERMIVLSVRDPL